MYLAHGGTNFGLSAGALFVGTTSSPTDHRPVATTYDFDAPINEQGFPTQKFFAFKKLIENYVNYLIP